MDVKRSLVLMLGRSLSPAAGTAPVKNPVGSPRGRLRWAENGNVILYVSNQSFDRDKVGIRVLIDGRTAVDRQFAVLDQHNWIEFRFNLEDGEHTLHAVSPDGQAVLEQRFAVAGRRWAVVDYWCCNSASEPKFTLHVSGKPILFD
jgi:hypothetical protein